MLDHALQNGRMSIYRKMVLITLLLIWWPGCGASDSTSATSDSGKLQILCTTGMLSGPLSDIGGSHAELTTLMGPGVEVVRDCWTFSTLVNTCLKLLTNKRNKSCTHVVFRRFMANGRPLLSTRKSTGALMSRSGFPGRKRQCNWCSRSVIRRTIFAKSGRL